MTRIFTLFLRGVCAMLPGMSRESIHQALFRAAYHGERENVRRLLARGADATVCSPYGETVLMGACRYHDTDLVQLLLRAGADPNAVRKNHGNVYESETPLINAVSCGNAAVVRLLLDSGAELDMFHDDARRLMYEACRSGSPETVELLAARGAQSPYGMPPLSYALVRGQENEVTALLVGGADAAQADTEGIAPLVWASLFGRVEMAARLEQAGVCVQDCPAALHAAARRDHAPMCAWLLERGVSPYSHDGSDDIEDCTALGTAIRHNSVQVAECLLQHGVDPGALTGAFEVPLVLAAESRSLPMAELLLRYGADVDGAAYEGAKTALMVAASKDEADMVRLLLEHGADTEAEDCDGWTALHEASCEPVAELLLQAGANPLAEDVAGLTPRDWALKLKRDEAVVALLEKAACRRKK